MNDVNLRIEEALERLKKAEINALLDGNGKLSNKLMNVQLRLEEIKRDNSE